MSATPHDTTSRARQLLKALRAAEVPEPGDAYWSSFAARVRLRLAESGAAEAAGDRTRRAAMAWGRLAFGLATMVVMAGVIWLAAGNLALWRDPSAGDVEPIRAAGPVPADVEPDDQAAAERLEALPAELLERALDDIVGSGANDLSGAEDLTGEDRRRLLEALRLEVAEGSPPQAAHPIVPEARLS